jgi:DNA-binding HxlR family transcriptional regulator
MNALRKAAGCFRPLVSPFLGRFVRIRTASGSFMTRNRKICFLLPLWSGQVFTTCIGILKMKVTPKWRSGCPLNASAEILCDRWSLLIIRDMIRRFRSYKQFLQSYEGIATNILADRLRKLIAHGIITIERDPSDGRKTIYSLTGKGKDLAPVLTEMVLWAAARAYGKSSACPANTKGQAAISRGSAATLDLKKFSNFLLSPFREEGASWKYPPLRPSAENISTDTYTRVKPARRGIRLFNRRQWV